MDRFDERKPDKATIDETNTDQPRQGDVLGLSGSEVPKSADDPSTQYDTESASNRRERARGGDVLGLAEETDDLTREGGATGIDLEPGGKGTDVKGE